MKNTLRLLLTVLAALVLPSCFQSATTLRLNPDGSGTLTEETTLGAQALAMIAQMAALGGGGPDPLADMASEEKAKQRLASLGEGVTLEKVEPIPGKGGRVVYRFADINKLKLDTNGAMTAAMPQMPGVPQAAAAADKVEPVTFQFADGVLTIKQPFPEKGEEVEVTDEDLAELENPEMQAMMAGMMGDMRISVKVIVDSGIAETNATYVDGNTVTLMEMEMGKLMKDPENLKKLSKIDQQNPAAAMEALKEIEGVKAEPKQEITIKVK